MKSRFSVIILMVAVIVLGCDRGRWQNQVDNLALECGVSRAYSPDSTYILKFTNQDSISDKKDLQVFRVAHTNTVMALDFNLSPKNCLMLQRADIENGLRIAVIIKNREAAEFVPQTASPALARVDLKECGRFCSAFPLCGLMPEAQKADLNANVFKLDVAEGVKVNVSVEADFTNQPLEVNERQCFALPSSSVGKLKVQDANGNFLEEDVGKVVAISARSQSPVETLSLRGALTAQEKMCKQNPSHYRMEGENCVAKSFRYYCEDSPLHSGVIALNGFFVRNDCKYMEQYLRSQSKLNFSYKNLLDAEIFSDLENLMHLELGGNRLSSLASLRGVPNVESLSIESNRGPFDIASIAQFRKLKKLNIKNVVLLNVDLLPIMDSVEDLEMTSDQYPILAKFTGLKRLLVRGGKQFDFSNITNRNLQYLEISLVPKLIGLEVLQEFTNLEEASFSWVDSLNASDFPAIPNLKKLYLQDIPFVNFNSLQVMPDLQDLTLLMDDKKPFLIPKLSQIKYLELNQTTLDLSWLEGWLNLQELKLAGNMESFESLPSLPSLISLDAFYVGVDNVKGLQNVPNLQHLILNNGSRLLDLNDFPQLSNLETLHCDGFLLDQEIPPSDISWMLKVPGLRVLRLDVNPIQKNLEDYLPKNLEDLRLKSYNLNNLEFLGKMSRLRTLDLALSGSMIKDAGHISVPPLDFLGIYMSIEGLKLLPIFAHAEVAEINPDSDSNNVGFNEASVLPEKILGVRKLTLQVEEIDLSWLKNLAGLEDLSLTRFLPREATFPELPVVKSLLLNGANDLTDLSGIEKFPNLEELDFKGTWNLNTLEPLMRLRKLRVITNGDRLRGSLLEEGACPETMEAPEGLREYCKNLQLPFDPIYGPLPF